MPLRNHFDGPQTKASGWEGMHSTWPIYIAQYLSRGVLPPHYFVVPQVTVGSIEVDVGTFETSEINPSANGGVATAVYAPAKPLVTAVVDWSIVVTSEVLIHESGGKLVAAIELVSPANKDRPANRQAFANKCASYLQQGCSLILIDVVTSKPGNLHAELMRLISPGLADSLLTDALRYCVSYRSVSIKGRNSRLDLWPVLLQVGEVLPVVPLWLAPDLALPLDLEKSYLDACELLRLS